MEVRPGEKDCHVCGAAAWVRGSPGNGRSAGCSGLVKKACLMSGRDQFLVLLLVVEADFHAVDDCAGCVGGKRVHCGQKPANAVFDGAAVIQNLAERGREKLARRDFSGNSPSVW